MKVLLAAQVVDFVRRLPPEPRQRLRRALRELSGERGDVKALEAPLGPRTAAPNICHSSSPRKAGLDSARQGQEAAPGKLAALATASSIFRCTAEARWYQ
jgi:hypothetical protein